MPSEALSSTWEVIEGFLCAPNEESFNSLFHLVAPWMLGYFRARGADVDMAEDLTQEVMLTVYKASHTLRNQDSFRPWLYRIAQNVLLRHFRDESRRVTTVRLNAEAEEKYGQAPNPCLRFQFSEWMASLNPDERKVMLLRYVDELEHHEIAAVLGIPMGTVQWRIFRSKRKLAARFGKEAT